MVGAVGFVGFGDWDCVVYCAVDDFWMELERLKRKGGSTLAGWEEFGGVGDVEVEWSCLSLEWIVGRYQL